MKCLVSAYTDIGLSKETNQDSVLVEVAQTECGEIAFAMVCDGMGGLDKGELASAMVIKAFARWFQFEFPKLREHGICAQRLKECWCALLHEENDKIGAYGLRAGIHLGTTVAGILICGDDYYVINVGDSRVYLLQKEIKRLTKDQSFVQMEVDAGRMTSEEAMKDARRNMLLQCVGASKYIEPEFRFGHTNSDTVYMLCSDGFRHTLKEQEMFHYLNPKRLMTERDMLENSTYLTEVNKLRQEQDNISVVLIKTCGRCEDVIC